MPSSQCPEKARLFTDLSDSMGAILVLNNRQMAAVLTGDFALVDNLKVNLQEARMRKDGLMSAYMTHVQEHGC